MYKRSLAIHEKVLGPDHMAVAADLSNVATLLASEVSVDPWSGRSNLVVRVLWVGWITTVPLLSPLPGYASDYAGQVRRS